VTKYCKYPVSRLLPGTLRVLGSFLPWFSLRIFYPQGGLPLSADGQFDFSGWVNSVMQQNRSGNKLVILNLFSATPRINAPAWCSTVELCGKASNISLQHLEAEREIPLAFSNWVLSSKVAASNLESPRQ
jgi:hypothetical protein